MQWSDWKKTKRVPKLCKPPPPPGRSSPAPSPQPSSLAIPWLPLRFACWPKQWIIMLFNTIQYPPLLNPIQYTRYSIQSFKFSTNSIPVRRICCWPELSSLPKIRSDVPPGEPKVNKLRWDRKTEKHFSVRARSQGKTEDRLPVAGFGAALRPNHLLLSQVRFLVQSTAGYSRETL